MKDTTYLILVDLCGCLQEAGINVVVSNPDEVLTAKMKFIFADNETEHTYLVRVGEVHTDFRELLRLNPNWQDFVTNVEDVNLMSPGLAAHLADYQVSWINNSGLIRVRVSDKIFSLIVSLIVRLQ